MTNTMWGGRFAASPAEVMEHHPDTRDLAVGVAAAGVRTTMAVGRVALVPVRVATSYRPHPRLILE